MTSTTSGTGITGETTHAPPEEKAPIRLVVTMALAQLGLFLALLTPVMASLTIKVQNLVGQDQAVSALGAVTGAGAAAAFLANPIFGRISDRTRGRFGRRRPWLIIGAVGLTGCLVVIANASSIAVVVVAWVVAQIFGNAAFAAFMATLADQIPMFQRGKIGGLLGVMQNVASLGAAYAALLFGGNMLLLFVVPGLVGLVLVTLFAFVLPDRPLPRHSHGQVGLRTFLKTFWVNPRQHPDFACTWASRFLIILAMFMFTTFRLLYIQNELSMSATKATGVMATGVLIYTIVLMVGAQIAGWVSDRLQRRKIFVGASTLVFGLGMVLLVQASSVTDFFVAEAVLGLGYGVYMGVDLALVVDVLPDKDDAAKDLGVFNIANAAPQALAPAVGAVLVGIGAGGNYDLLLGVAAGICVLGALVIVPLKSVR